MNNEPKRVLGNKTPFCVYFGRDDGNETSESIRNLARKATEKASEEMIRRQKKTLTSYKINDNVLVKCKKSNKKVIVEEGTIVECRGTNYKVRINGEIKTFCVSDLKKTTIRQKGTQKQVLYPFRITRCNKGD